MKRISPIARNIIGVVVLMLAWYLPDRFFFAQREGFQKFLPYLMLLTMYGWIVFHNRMLLERLYLDNKRNKYFIWTGIIMIIASLNVYLTIHFLFAGSDPLPQILGFWVFTIAGAGIYLLFHDPIVKTVVVQNSDPSKQITNFEFTADERQHSLPVESILYVESLENYIKVITGSKVFLVRMSLKQAEQTLSPMFIRISRSHLVNRKHIESFGENEIRVNGQELKVGKVYKKYVMEAISRNNDIQTSR